jgi:Rrf2 family iron-sulfur cluster assembly transcriptional regulator
MMELALRHNKGPVTLADISAQQSISISYLEQLFARLRQHKLVTGMRGPGGGYCLSRQASEISIADILSAVDDMVRRDEMPQTAGDIPGSMLMWQRLSNQVYDYLNSISLADAVEHEEDDAQASLFGPGFQKSAA